MAYPFEQKQTSRRDVLRLAAAGGLVLLGANLRGSNFLMPPDVVASGHVQRLRVGNATVHLARRSGFKIGGGASPTFHLWGGQAAVDIDSALEILTVSTPLADIIVHNALLSLVVEGTTLAMTVIRGAAGVVVRGQATSSAIKVVAGQEIKLRAGDARPAPIAVPEAWRELEWIDGWLTFKDEPLVEAVASLNRFNLIQIVVPGELSNVIVRDSGRYSLADPHAFALRVARMTGLEVTNDETAKIIRLRRRDRAFL